KANRKLRRAANRQIRGCISTYQALPLMFGSTLYPPPIIRACGVIALWVETSAGCTSHSPSPQVPNSGDGSSSPSALHCLLVLQYLETPGLSREQMHRVNTHACVAAGCWVRGAVSKSCSQEKSVTDG